jgi:hypothetical protein
VVARLQRSEVMRLHDLAPGKRSIPTAGFPIVRATGGRAF